MECRPGWLQTHRYPPTSASSAGIKDVRHHTQPLPRILKLLYNGAHLQSQHWEGGSLNLRLAWSTYQASSHTRLHSKTRSQKQTKIKQKRNSGHAEYFPAWHLPFWPNPKAIGCTWLFSAYLGHAYVSAITPCKYKSFPDFLDNVSLFSASCTSQGGACVPVVLWLPHMPTVKLNRASLFPGSSVLLIPRGENSWTLVKW